MTAEKLIIYLPDEGISQWGILHNTGAFEKKLTSINEIANQEFAEVIVIAPPTSILLTETTLPKMSKQRLLQALPFALEEHLLAEISELHFAIPPLKKFAKDAEEVTVCAAVVAKEKINKWLHNLNEFHIYPTVIFPAPLLIEKEEQCWSVFVEDHFSLLRNDNFQGSTFDTANLNAYLSFKLHESVEKPHTIFIYNFTDKKINLTLDVNIIEKPVGNNKIFDYFVKCIAQPNINLLQGLHQSKRKVTTKKIWQGIIGLASAWIFIILITNTFSYFLLHSKELQLQASIKKIYQENFPHATSVVAAKKRMTDKLNSLANGGQKNHFFAWLGALGESIEGNNQFQIKQMDYRNNILDLQFTATDFSVVDKIEKSLNKQGFHTKQQNVSKAGEEVKGVLTISEGNVS